MHDTRVRVQLQTGHRDVVPAVVIHDLSVSYLTVAMMVRTIAENAVGHRVFTKKRDGEACIKAARLHEATGVDQLQLLMQTETISHKQVMSSIEMFGKHVIPEFRKAG